MLTRYPNLILMMLLRRITSDVRRFETRTLNTDVVQWKAARGWYDGANSHRTPKPTNMDAHLLVKGLSFPNCALDE